MEEDCETSNAGIDEADHAKFSDDVKERLRFEVELEFVQCLSNPMYLHHLASTLVLEDERVLNYLEYLQYWKKPEYARHIRFPHCLYFLELLQNKAFRQKLRSPEFAQLIFNQQFYHWLYYNGGKFEVGALKN